MNAHRTALVFLVSMLAVFFAHSPRAQAPSPKAFFGHVVGEDYELIDYLGLVRYFRAVESASDRVVLSDIGPTSYGQRMQMAIITSPANHARLERLRQLSVAMAHPDATPDADLDESGAAQKLAAELEESCAVVWIDGGLHATEAIAGQNIIELVWRMASRDDEEVQRILDRVVLLVVPANPDGYELVANAYAATGSTRTPVLYQRYVGHDNNRDFYACNQLEAQNISRVFYREWCPQIVYNHHQTAPRNTIIYTPPFRDPFNYRIDPLVVRGIEIVSAHMNHRFALEDKPGVISRSGASYSAWWNGGLRSTTYFHNMIGILTESFGHPAPTPIEQPRSRRLPYHDYPQPVGAQLWHARQTIEYLQTANFAILDYAARCKDSLVGGMHAMAMRAIEAGRRDHWTVTPKMLREADKRENDSVFVDPAWRDPRAYVLPSNQPNFSGAVRLARSLWHGGIDILRATEAFPAAGREMPAGSLVMLCDQPYRAHLLDMLEPQWHPDDLRDGKPVPPYDAAGWTLSMQMDVDVVRSFEELRGPFEPLTSIPEVSPKPLPVASRYWTIDARDLCSIRAVNRLLAADCVVEHVGAADPSEESGDGWADFYRVPVAPASSTVLAKAVRELGVRVEIGDLDDRAVSPAPGSIQRIERVRVGLFDVFGGHMATGWDRWLLDQFEFPVEAVYGERIEQGNLREDFDVLIFHTGMPGARDLDRARSRGVLGQLADLREALPPFEDWSDLEARAVRVTGEKGLPALRRFVADGGTLLALGREVGKAVRHFQLPVKVGTHVASDASSDASSDAVSEGEEAPEERRTTRDEYYIPGSLVGLDVARRQPLTRGCPADLAAMMYRTATVLEVEGDGENVAAVATYSSRDTLRSGWAIGLQYLKGKAAVVSAKVGEGRVILYGIDATYRGQSLGTARMFFQGILTARRL
ncbi:MAG: M14 family metallopeptidase [Planctomycetota bacterium]